MDPFSLHASILKNSPPGALGVFTGPDKVTHIVLPRTYYPLQSTGLTDVSVKNIVHRSAPLSSLYFTTARDPRTKILDRRSIIVFCGAKCSTTSSRAGVGVFFGPASEHNIAERISLPDPQYAGLHAVHRTLQIGRAAIGDKFSLNRIVIATDSEYAFRALTEWVFRWQHDGWKDDSGRDIPNADKVKEIDQLIDDMAADGLDVEIWRITAGDNQDAHGMASVACGS